jgi:hypothetical protein
VFGFAALKPVLVEEGVYHDQCTEDELRDGIELCKQQDLGYALVLLSIILALTCLDLTFFSPSRLSRPMCPRSRLEQSSIAMDHASVVLLDAL